MDFSCFRYELERKQRYFKESKEGVQNYQVSLKQYLVILLFHMRIQEDLEGELRIQSEVTQGFLW